MQGREMRNDKNKKNKIACVGNWEWVNDGQLLTDSEKPNAKQ
jgi:hypothetical protein